MSIQSSTLKINHACESGKKFAELFYEQLDKNRHLIGQLYHDTATLIWNGNHIVGKTNIVQFYMNLPAIDTNLHGIDSQPVSQIISKDHTSILVTCNGRMAINRKQQHFNESFMLIAENNVWKIVTDTFRNY
ncbi:NTF2- export protein 2 [Dermatophagoides farinae]|mgnify:FL=1|uniref:NTF2-related export protein n=1 Tax=Dermatophagoides farinae TaxID=6954 RepID=A0A922HPX8_DERFA|nr:NTF2-related export protein 2-like [Dermatophagoides farinae]KAH7637692.1 hypothetical protein HUG17_8796 [Dermatophagoides farinae]KAH9501810.1 NTF2- export protein 2 [Dermatophagoides farinae]